MSEILCVTNRKLCGGEFLAQVEKLAAARPAGIILREKDLPEEEYRSLAAEVMEICKPFEVPCILHSFWDVAEELGCPALHLPMPLLRELSRGEREQFSILGASCHSAAEAREAQALGCTYVTAGHIFETDCKRGLPGRGLTFLRDVCEEVSIPVYAIGGITPERIDPVKKAGAAGACVMSGAMTCGDAKQYLRSFETGQIGAASHEMGHEKV